MDYLKYLIYGLIQGFTEFLPISSTAHLKVLSEFFGFDDPGSSISAILQLGSVLAILFYFRNDLLIFLNWSKKNNKKKSNNFRLIKSITIGTLFFLFLGGIVKVFIPNYSESFLRTNLSIAFISILMSILMIAADKAREKEINLINHNFLDSCKIGLGQALAIIPGVSRSGITISIALLLGWEKKDATKFSFLLGLPAISLAAFVELFDSIYNDIYLPLGPLFIGLSTTFLISLLSINFLVKFIPLNGLKIFAYYRIIFGTVILISYF